MSAGGETEQAGWRADVEEARRVLAGLDADRELARAREQVAEWRSVASFSGFFLPMPLVIQDVPSLDGGWVDGRLSADLSDRWETVGVDAEGRPVVHLLDPEGDWERPNHFWRWSSDGSFLEIELMGSGPHVRKARSEAGALRSVVTASRHGTMQLARLHWEDGRCVRADGATGFAIAFARRLELGPGGEQMVRSTGEPYDGKTIIDDDTDAGLRLLQETLARAAALQPERLDFDGRVSTPEPWPGEDAAGELVEPVAQALASAFADAVEEHSLPTPPFVLTIATGRGGDGSSWPPYGLLASSQWREGRRRASRQDEAALTLLWQGVESGEVERVEIVDRLDAEVLRACRVLRSSFSLSTPLAQHRAAAPVAERIGDRLAELLAQRDLQRTVDPFVALVGLGDPYRETRYDASERAEMIRARSSYGDEHVERFLSSVKAAPKRRRLSRHLVQRAQRDREALRELVEHLGLEAHAERILAAVRPAVELRTVPVTPATRSRLGGPPLLPADVPWPRTADGTPLSFLAAIDLAEVSTPALPDDGWLLFYAALDPDEGGIVDDVDGTEGSPARLLRVEAHDTPTNATAPEELGQLMIGGLQHRGVEPIAQITLPDGYDAGSQLGLDVHESVAYDELLESLRSGGLPMERHWVGGAVTGAQGHPHDPDSELLLHLGPDENLGFEFLDGGTLQFLLNRAALAAGRWSAVEVVAESS